MSELEALKEAVEACHGAAAAFIEELPVREVFRSRTVWDGAVFTFALDSHPTADRCYALRVDGKILTVLHEPPVDSPMAAVRAAIREGYRAR